MKAEDITHILHDPRPTEPDTKRWRVALLLLHRVVPDPVKAIDLGSRLWTMRAMGAVLEPSRGGLRFGYLPRHWVDEAEFEEFKKIAFGEYREEILQLLNQVEFVVDKQEVPEVWKALAI